MLSREDAQRATQLLDDLRSLNQRLLATDDRDERAALHREIDACHNELARLIPAY